jgi:2-hydroxychromene-2-carboxylate isomerase
MRARKPPRLYFSFRSPFSWMALHQLEQRLPECRELIEYYPYWEPDSGMRTDLEAQDSGTHYTAMSKAKHLYILQDTKRLAARYGYSMKWPIDIDPQWELPHLAWLRAKHLGHDKAFYDAVTEARWQRAENVCEPEVLRRIAESVGLDGDLLLSSVDDPDLRAEGTRILASAYDDDVFGIPYFKLGPHRFWGLDRLEAFLEVLLPALENNDELKGPLTVNKILGARA